MSGYFKLFSEIIYSSIWKQDSATCKVWITLLAVSNQYGYVRGSVGWLAGMARVSIEECQKAIDYFKGPDPESRTPDNEGRRIKDAERGWIILNYEWFRSRDGLSEDPRRIYQRTWMQKKRASDCKQSVNTPVNESQQVLTPASASVSESVPKEIGGVGGRGKPTLEEVKLLGAKTGLTEDQCCHFYDYYESNGWRVGRNPMRSVSHAIANWKRNSQSYGSNGYSRAQTPNDLRLIIDAKQKTCDSLKAKHCTEGPLGNTWSNDESRSQFAKLRKEIKDLTQKLSSMA